MNNPAVFIDRDGTMIEQVDVLTDPAQLRVLPGTAEAIARLNKAGFLVIGITNQPIIEKGLLTMEGLEKIHAALQEMISASGTHIDGFFTCPHRYHPDKECECRKPNQGLINQARAAFPIDMDQSWFVGDRLRDVETGRRAHVKTIFVKTGGESSDDQFFPDAKADFVAEDLSEAVDNILKNR
jgi:histidinol-phosphate phosphatase family protein